MSKNVNPNQSVQEEAKTTQSFGEATSFDQLESLATVNDRSQKVTGRRRRADPEEEGGAGSHGEFQADTETDIGDSEASQESEGQEAQAINPEQSDEAIADSEAEASFGIKREEPEVKVLKARVGDDYVEIQNDAVFSHKVDGEMTDVPLQELLNNYSGKVAYDKRFNELAVEKKEHFKERKNWQKDVDFVNKNIQQLMDTANEDPTRAMQFLCRLTGKDPAQHLKKFYEDQVKLVQDLSQLDPEQRERYYLKLERDNLNKERESEAKRRNQQKEQQEALQRLQQTRETFGLDEDTYDELALEIEEGNYLDGKEASVDDVIEFYQSKRVFGVLEGISEALVDNDEAFNNLIDIAKANPDFSDDDLADIAKEVFMEQPASKASKNLSRKVLKTQPAPQVQRKPTRQEVWSFDQLD